MAGTIQRPALGQNARLGQFYDAHEGKFLLGNLFQEEITQDCISQTKVEKENQKAGRVVSYGDSYEETLGKLGFDAQLGASFLAGTVEAKGCNRYLYDKNYDSQVGRAFILEKLVMLQEKLDLSNKRLPNMLALNAISSSEITHFVSRIDGVLRHSCQQSVE